MTNERLLRESLGRPRRVLVSGPVDLTGIGAEITLIDRAPDGVKFDAAVVVLPQSDDEALAQTRACVARLDDGGHLLFSLQETFNFAQATMLRQSASHDRTVDLATRAGLEVLRIDVGGSPLAHHAVVVTRVAPKKGKLSLTVGMLTLNEQESVETMIDEIRTYAPDAKLLLIDSSSDTTPELARAKGAEVIRQLPARGHGPAMERLMYAAAEQSDALIYIDCDFTYPTSYIPRVLELLEEGADLVNATRTHAYPKAMPVPNFIANRVFAAVTHAVHGVPTTDVHSGLRGYRSSLIRAFAFNGEQDALPVSTLVLPARSNYNVVDLPIPYAERVGVSKLAKVRGTLWTFARIATSMGHGHRVRRGGRYSHVRS